MESRAETTSIIDRNVVGFWFLGLVNNFSFVVFISAAEDLLSGYAGVILLCTILPGLLTKLTISLWVHRLSYTTRVAVLAISVSVSMATIALSHSLIARLLCLAVYSLIGALGEISFLALTSHYPPSTVGAWSSGTGMAGIAGAGAYYTMRQLLRCSPGGTLLALSVVPLSLIALYAFVLDQRHSSVSYTPMKSLEESNSEVKGAAEDDEELTLSKKEVTPILLVHYILPLGVVYFAEYAINQGVLGTFRPSSFGNLHSHAEGKDKSHRLYTWFQLVYQIGVFVSRSSISFLKIGSLWAMPLLQCFNLIFLTLASLYSFLPSATIASIVVFWEGLLGGAQYVNTYWKLRTRFPVQHREWALAVVPVGDAVGIALAAGVGIWLERLILREQGRV